MTDSRDKRVDQILQQLEDLPALPEIAVRVLQSAGSESAVADLLKALSSDAGLSRRIQQLAGEPATHAAAEDWIGSSLEAIDFGAVAAAVLAISVFQTFGSPIEPTADRRFDREGFWQHSLAVGCLAELFAQQSGPDLGVTPSEAFLAGLLHDLGKLALDVALPKSYARVIEATDLLRGDLIDLERKILGIDHQIAGKRLAEKWQLPPSVRDVAWLHGQSPGALPATVRSAVINLVTLADVLVRQQHLGYSGNHTFPVTKDELLLAVGISAKQADAALAALFEQMEPRIEALGLGRTTGQALYRQAIEQANRELSRVSVQLESKARQLNRRARFFDVLEQFQNAVRADARPPQVLSAIASAAGVSVHVERLAAFSLAPGRDRAETVLCDAQGAVIESALIDLPGLSGLTETNPLTADELREIAALEEAAQELAGTILPTVPPQEPLPPAPASPADPRKPSILPGDGPVLSAGDDIEWLIGALSPRLPAGNRFWICLQSEGACIGGVVWSAPPGEAARLLPQAHELSALSHTWALSLRMAQVRDESRTLAEELAEANRRLHAAQDAILRSRSLTTIGELAAGAAHEMNNPLAVISGRSQLLASQLTDPKQQSSARLIHEQSDRLSDIITELMAFAKPQPPVVRSMGVDRLIIASIALAKSQANPADRQIITEAIGVPNVAVDEKQLSAALAEIIANAIQATETDGRIVIRAAHDPWSDKVVIDVSDDGVGMDDTTLRRAFDPFFSSKPAGRRRGLGLPKALRWIEAVGGSIRLISTPGNGTRALVLLPTATDEDQRATDRADRRKDEPDGELQPDNAPRRLSDEASEQDADSPAAGARRRALRG